MTDYTWFGGTGSFTDASDWSPTGVPVAGDAITLGKGKLEVTDQNLIDIPVTMGSYYGATLDLKDSIIGNIGLTVIPTPTAEIESHHTFDVSGYAVFAGTISTGGEFADTTTINIDHGSVLWNIGDLAFTPTEGETLNINGSGGTLLNDGLIEAEADPGAYIKIGSNVVGFGTIELGVGAPVTSTVPAGKAEFAGDVGAGQTFEFSGASGATASTLLLQIDIASAFKGTIANFGSLDEIELKNTKVTSDSFSGGVLTLSDGSSAVAHLHFSGSYTTSDFATHVSGGDSFIKLA